MLLDRRKVKFWQKIVFGAMAFLMAAFLIVGYSGVINGCNFGSSTQSAGDALNQEIAKYKTATASSPESASAWTKLADAYLSRSAIQTQGSDAQTADMNAAVAAYTKADALLAKQKGKTVTDQRVEVLSQLASVYASLGDAQAAATAYGDITTLKPKDAQAFFNLGAAANTAGDTSTALLAFNRFLELDPQSPDASAVKDWIKQNTPEASTPTPSPTK